MEILSREEIMSMDPIECVIRFDKVKRALRLLNDGYIKETKEALEEALRPAKYYIETGVFAPVLPFKLDEDFEGPWAVLDIGGIFYHQSVLGNVELGFEEDGVWFTIVRKKSYYEIMVRANGKTVAKFFTDEKPWFVDYRELEKYVTQGVSKRAILRMILTDLLEPLREFTRVI